MGGKWLWALLWMVAGQAWGQQTTLDTFLVQTGEGFDLVADKFYVWDKDDTSADPNGRAKGMLGTETLIALRLTTSEGLRLNLSDETGAGAAVFAVQPTFLTDIRTPLVIGGTAATSDLVLKTTTGVGATGADMHFRVGNNGGTQAMTILNNGDVLIPGNLTISGTLTADVVEEAIGLGDITPVNPTVLLGRYSVGPGPAQEITLTSGEFSVAGGVLTLVTPYQPLSPQLTGMANLPLLQNQFYIRRDPGPGPVTHTMKIGPDFTLTTGTMELANDYQAIDPDLTDLADGSLTGSKVGPGIDATNITAGKLPNARLDDDLTAIGNLTLEQNQFYARTGPGPGHADATVTINPGEFTLTDNVLSIASVPGNLVGGGINANNITTGTLPNARLDADLVDLADGSLTGSKVGTGIDATNITTGTLHPARLSMTKAQLDTAVTDSNPAYDNGDNNFTGTNTFNMLTVFQDAVQGTTVTLTDGIVNIATITPPGAAPAGYIRLYGKTDGLLYSKNSAGAETVVSGGGSGGSGGLTDNDYGDVVVGGSGTTMTIDTGAVTLAKMAPVTGSKLIGRHTGSTGAPQEIGVSGDFTVSGGTLALVNIYQPANMHLADLADGTLTGSKVGTGINATNITTGTLPNAQLDADLAAIGNLTLTQNQFYVRTGVGSGPADKAITISPGEFSLSATPDTLTIASVVGSKVGVGINASNITTGTLPNAQLDADLQDLADGSLGGSKVGTGIDATNITAGTLAYSVMPDQAPSTLLGRAPGSTGKPQVIAIGSGLSMTGGILDVATLRSAPAATAGPVTLAGYKVATLPAGTVGMTAYVTDAKAPTYLGALTGGGAVACPVFHNGTAWVSH